MKITRGKRSGGQKVVIYGVEGIGKTTLSMQFPDPVFIDTEGSTKHFDVARLPDPTSWEMLKSEVQWVIDNLSTITIGTLVIDTADWAEALCNQAICKQKGVSGIEDFSYGKGYVFVREEFGRLLDLLSRVTDRGIHTVLTAHSALRKVEQPDDMGSYDKWELKLSKQVAPLVKEWADLLLFCNYKTFVVKSETGKGKAQGGKRVMYASHHSCWDAKNRHGLPDEMPMKYSQIAHLFVPAQTAPLGQQAPERVEQSAVSAREEPPENPTPAATAAVTGRKAPVSPPAARAASIADPTPTEEQLANIYTPLADLMRTDGINPTELMLCVNDRLPGCFPEDMPPEQYPQDFIDQWVIPNWENVKSWVWNDRQLPF